MHMCMNELYIRSFYKTEGRYTSFWQSEDLVIGGIVASSVIRITWSNSFTTEKGEREREGMV